MAHRPSSHLNQPVPHHRSKPDPDLDPWDKSAVHRDMHNAWVEAEHHSEQLREQSEAALREDDERRRKQRETKEDIQEWMNLRSDREKLLDKKREKRFIKNDLRYHVTPQLPDLKRRRAVSKTAGSFDIALLTTILRVFSRRRTTSCVQLT